MSNNSIFAGLDVGSTEVRCVVANIGTQGEPHIIGFSKATNTGMRKGIINRPEEVKQAINNVIEEAERVCGHEITHVTVNINGNHIESQMATGVVAISSSDRVISDDDRNRAEEAATVLQLPANREILQILPNNYRVDEQDEIKDPIGMQGTRLEVDALIVTGSTPHIKTLEHVISDCNLGVNHLVAGGLATAEAVLTRTARESGSVVVDIGAGTTNILVVDEGEIQHIAVIPVGGMHFTNDLAIGLKTNLDLAEHIKTNYIDLAKKQLGSKKISNGQEELTVDMAEAKEFIEARGEELSELIDKELKKVGYSRKLPGGVILVGGGSKIAGLDEFFKHELELPVARGKLQDLEGMLNQTDADQYLTAAGLMLLDMLLGESSSKIDTEAGILNKAKKLFKRSK